MGAFERLPDDQRVGRKMMSPSKLVDMRQGPEVFEAKHITGRIKPESSQAMEFGTLVHCAILEPDKLKERYIFFDENKYLKTIDDIKKEIINQGQVPVKGLKADLIKQLSETKSEKKALDTLNEEIEKKGIILVNEKDTHRLTRILEEVVKHQNLKKAMVGGRFEQSAWFEHESGLTFTMRMDVFSPDFEQMGKKLDLIMDYKTVNEFDEYEFRKIIFKFGWHIKAYIYIECVKRLRNKEPYYIFPVIESKEPHRVRTMIADEAMIEKGKEDFDFLVERYLYFLNKGIWEEDNAKSFINTSVPWYALKDNHASRFD